MSHFLEEQRVGLCEPAQGVMSRTALLRVLEVSEATLTVEQR